MILGLLATTEKRVLARVSRVISSPGRAQLLVKRCDLASVAFLMAGVIARIAVWTCLIGWLGVMGPEGLQRP